MRYILQVLAILFATAAFAQTPLDRLGTVEAYQTKLDRLEIQMQAGKTDWQEAAATVEAASAALYPGQALDLKTDVSKLKPDPAGHNENAAMWRQQIWPQVMGFYQKVNDEARTLKGH